MNTREDEYLHLSSIQHFAFCPRQWGLMVLEAQWADNWRTTSGTLLHSRAHDAKAKEKRGDAIALRALKVVSHTLALSGECDVVEFLQDENGCELFGYTGKYRPFPVEYKRGKEKPNDADSVQLCAQAIALEEMLCCDIPSGALFYGETRRRTDVFFTAELRETTRRIAGEMHRALRSGVTPKPVHGQHCAACSLSTLCLPKLQRESSVQKYIKAHVEE